MEELINVIKAQTDATIEHTKALTVIKAQTDATIEHTKALTVLNGKLDQLIRHALLREKALLGLIVFLIVAILALVGIKLNAPLL